MSSTTSRQLISYLFTPRPRVPCVTVSSIFRPRQIFAIRHRLGPSLVSLFTFFVKSCPHRGSGRVRWCLGSPPPGWGSLTRQMFLYISIILRLTRGSSWSSSILPGRCSPPSLLFGWCNRAPWGYIFGRWASRWRFLDNDLSSLYPSFLDMTLILDRRSAAMLRCSPRRFLLSITLVITL